MGGSTQVGVIRLTEADWRVFAALRLRALADSAGTDDAEYRTEMSFTGTQWRRRLRALRRRLRAKRPDGPVHR